MNNKSWLTAIGRKSSPLPTRYLLSNGLLNGRILDYGCGRCAALNTSLGIDSYDPHFAPELRAFEYDTIICNYVLCTLSSARARKWVIDGIRMLLAPGGKAYITVRRGDHELGKRKNGTWQGIIKLRLPIVRETAGYCIYLLEQ